MKKLFVLLVSLLMIITMSGCGSESSSDKKVVGILQFVQHEALDAATQGFKDELIKEFGDNIVFDENNASGQMGDCNTMASNLVAEKCDLILGNATPALQALATATNEIPVLGTAVTEYGIALGIDDFNGTVGSNVSGTSDLANLEQQADIILELFPDAKNVGILYCSAEDNSKYQFEVVDKYLKSKGINVVNCPFTETSNLEDIVRGLCKEVDAIYVPTDNAAASADETIGGITRTANIPVVTGEVGTIDVLGVATQSIDYYELGVITGKMAGKILRGEAKVSEMPIEYYSDYYNEAKKYNKEIASELGITVPDTYEAIN